MALLPLERGILLGLCYYDTLRWSIFKLGCGSKSQGAYNSSAKELPPYEIYTTYNPKDLKTISGEMPGRGDYQHRRFGTGWNNHDGRNNAGYSRRWQSTRRDFTLLEYVEPELAREMEGHTEPENQEDYKPYSEQNVQTQMNYDLKNSGTLNLGFTELNESKHVYMIALKEFHDKLNSLWKDAVGDAAYNESEWNILKMGDNFICRGNYSSVETDKNENMLLMVDASSAISDMQHPLETPQKLEEKFGGKDSQTAWMSKKVLLGKMSVCRGALKIQDKMGHEVYFSIGSAMGFDRLVQCYIFRSICTCPV